MDKLMRDEQGVSLIEMLSVIAVLGIFFSITVGLFHSIAKTSSIQNQMVEIQQTANGMIAKIEQISKTAGVYEEAGYLGKYVGKDWKDVHIIKQLSLEEDDCFELSPTEQGVNKTALTDITDTLNQSKEVFQVKNSNIKLKILQQKNENEATKTIHSTLNYRDTFSIQTTVMVLFYTKEIEFSEYYDEETGFWSYDQLRKHPNVVYSRETVVQYRDDAKSKGEVPGNGRW